MAFAAVLSIGNVVIEKVEAHKRKQQSKKEA